MLDYSRLKPWVWGFTWTILVLTAMSFRPLMPVDETRYIAVAWEMWLREDFLVPHLNGSTYSHKPPLLFWIINAGWGIFGVNDWWPRLIAPLFGLACLGLSASTCRRLWPKTQAYLIVPILLIGNFYWAIYTTLTMFDLILTLWTLVGINGMIDVSQNRWFRGWLLFSIAVGFGALSKGPVILVYLMPVALLCPYWAINRQKQKWVVWYLGMVIGVLVGAGIALAWALPAGFSGGEEYKNAIFWGQSAGRIVQSFAHRQPIWWYLAIIPILLLPWVLWPSLLRKLWLNLREINKKENPNQGLRLMLIWSIAPIIILSAISGKQPHYLLPIFPPLAITGAVVIASLTKKDFLRGYWDMSLQGLFLFSLGAAVACSPELGALLNYSEWTANINRWWALPLFGYALLSLIKPPQEGCNRLLAISGLSSIFVISLFGFLKPIMDYGYDLQSVSNYIAKAQRQGYAVAYYGKYHGQFHFLGKLKKPITETGDGHIENWLAKTPRAKIISIRIKIDESSPKPDFVAKFRSKYIAIWDRSTVLSHPTAPQRK